MLHLNGVVYRIGTRTILDGAGVHIPAGRRVGLVGRNGAGKSTLLRLITGELTADDGDLQCQRRARIAALAQEAPGGDTAVVDFVLAGDRERAELLDELDSEPAPERAAEVHARLVEIGAQAAPARAARILAGLGFDAEAQARPLSSFSGGWRMRVALAAVLFAEPDLLLLDEPTNYLDLEGVLWLEGHLRRYPHTLVLVSHERDLLNRAVDHILHLQDGKLTLYRGGYDEFERRRRERQAQDQKLRQRQEAQRKHMQAFVDRFRYKASKARQAQSRLKALARLEPIAAAVEEPHLAFEFPTPRSLRPPLLTTEAAAVGYAPGAPVLQDLDLRIDPDDRIALIGPNGNGKTTLARLLAGRLAAESGDVRRAGKLNVGFFAQHLLEEFRPDETALSQLTPLMPGKRENEVRAHLGRFGLVGERAKVTAAGLSGGERARLALATITADEPELLILDEPTNHLDIDAREALIHALSDYAGAVVLISHDRHLVDLAAERLWLVADGTVRPFDGDLDDYRRGIADGGSATPEPVAPAAQAEAKGNGDRRKARQDAAQRREALSPLRQRVRAAERRLQALQSKLKEVERQLAAPDLYARVPAQATDLNRRRAEIGSAIAAAEGEWLSAAEALELAEADSAG